jgi:transposase
VQKGQGPPWIVSDELWARIEPLLPAVPRRDDHPGRRGLDDRKVLCGILIVLASPADPLTLLGPLMAGRPGHGS